MADARQPGDHASTCSATATPTSPADMRAYSCPRSATRSPALRRPPRARPPDRRRHLARRQRRARDWRPATRSAARGLFIEMPVLDNALVAAGVDLPADPARAAVGEAAAARRRRGDQPRSRARTTWSTSCSTGPAAPAGGLGGGARGDPVRPHRAAARGAPADRTAGAGDRPPRRPAASRSPTPTCWSRRCRGARLVDAESIFEWRVNPERLDDELGGVPRRGLRRRAGRERRGRGRLSDLGSP